MSSTTNRMAVFFNFQKFQKLNVRKNNFVQQPVRNVCAKVWSWSFQLFSYWSSSSVYNLTIKFSFNIFSNQIIICQISFEILYLCRETNLYLKSRYLSSIRAFPFYFMFLLKWNKNEFFNKRIQERKGCRETFLAEVTGNSVSDHYARNIYIKVFLKIASLWILERSKILY